MRLQYLALAALLLSACNPQKQGDATESAPAPEAASPTTGAPATSSPATPLPVAEVTWRAIGTEPFWGVRVEAGNLVFTTPEDQQGRVLPATQGSADGATVFSGNDAGQAYTLTLTPGECSDGMSDRKFSHKAEFALGDDRYSGCAAAPGEPWGE